MSKSSLQAKGKNGAAHGTGQSPTKRLRAELHNKPSLDRRAISQKPPPWLYLDNPRARDVFMEALAHICASAVVQTCPTDPLHPKYMAEALENRTRVQVRSAEERRRNGTVNRSDIDGLYHGPSALL